jgi:tRNA (guanine37-N1)-methyltransferase
MPTQAICLKIPKRQGEKALNLANRLKLLDKELEIEKDDDFLYIPLARQPSPNDLETLKNEVARIEVST